MNNLIEQVKQLADKTQDYVLDLIDQVEGLRGENGIDEDELDDILECLNNTNDCLNQIMDN